MSIRNDVDRGLEIREQMDKLKIELKDIETRLQMAALRGEQVDLVDAERDGRQFLAKGSERVLPVILTADLLIGSFMANSETHRAVLNIAGFQFGTFYKSVHKFENRFADGKKFRAAAAELLGLDAPRLITACVARDKDGIAKSAIKIMWEETNPA